MDIIITRYVGICGTAILAREYRDELLKRLPGRLVEEAEAFDKEALSDKYIGLALENGAKYVSEYDEYGIYEALFQMAKALHCGIEVNICDIPIKQETIEICEHLNVNPYALYSGYSAVIVCDDGHLMKEILENSDVPAAIVGRTTGGNDKIIINGDERGFLPHIRKDELKNKLGRRAYNERENSIDN